MTQFHLSINYAEDKKVKSDFHSHQAAELFYFHKGKCTYLIGDRILPLSSGSVILMNGMTLHRPKLFEGSPYIRTTIHFNQPYYSEILTPMGMPQLVDPFKQLSFIHLAFQDEEQSTLESYLVKMNELQQSETEMDNFKFQLSFMELLTFLYPYCQNPLQDSIRPQSDKEKHVQKVISYIETHYQRDFHLDILESELHLSKYYLSKIFKEVTGVTIFKYLLQKRINQAKVSLTLEPEQSITDLSYQHGFKYPSHFSRIFKQLTGETPEYYRKQLMSG
ncbi:AraC family transcriptional regulator [Alkalicoccobacillus porphyridii]|uniref:Helix-turn-helix domain-containing protein n=1 Tax=Alkalicoccobacillus porphyridii TaxID=2597270 RepID=A0A554A304_9BACI|nr:AraC family transcriptional regulator [Alkalicoccobacillus porphyridii]TSB48080.1 helix-turn-helix domain-containing protein [Alkalicoccobacillus porphyridii]